MHALPSQQLLSQYWLPVYVKQHTDPGKTTDILLLNLQDNIVTM